MADAWENAVKAAKKILGPNGKIPEFPPTINKTGVALGKSWDEFVEARKKLKEQFDAHLTKFDQYQGARFAYIDVLERDNLGLNPKDKAENSKIAEAKKPLLGVLNKWHKAHEDHLNDFKKLNGPLSTILNFVEPG